MKMERLREVMHHSQDTQFIEGHSVQTLLSRSQADNTIRIRILRQSNKMRSEKENVKLTIALQSHTHRLVRWLSE